MDQEEIDICEENGEEMCEPWSRLKTLVSRSRLRLRRRGRVVEWPFK